MSEKYERQIRREIRKMKIEVIETINNRFSKMSFFELLKTVFKIIKTKNINFLFTEQGGNHDRT